MKNVIHLALLVIVTFMLIPERASAGAGLRICNRDNSTYMIAVLSRNIGLFGERWEASGWHHIDPGRCERWSKGDVSTLYLLSVTEQTDSGQRVLDYGVDHIPRTHWETGTYGIEHFYCVSNEAYRRTGNAQTRFVNCRNGEYLQLFNLQIFVRHDSNYTLRLGG